MKRKKKQDLLTIGMIFGLMALLLLVISVIMPPKPTYQVMSAELKVDTTDKHENIRPVYEGVVVLDPGHGGYDSGASSIDEKILEKDLDLEIALKVKAVLEENHIQVIMTRESDEVSWPSDNVKDLQARVDIATNHKADLMVSLHCNMSDEDIYNVSGCEIYVNQSQKKSVALAEKISNEFDKLGSSLPNRGIKTDTLHVLTYNKVPTVLVEMGFLSNPDDVDYLTNQKTQNLMVNAIANGIIAQIKADQ